MRVLIPFFGILMCLLIVVYFNTRDSDSPRRRDVKRLRAENVAMRRVLNELDSRSREDYAVTQNPHAWWVSDKIAQIRTGELN